MQHGNGYPASMGIASGINGDTMFLHLANVILSVDMKINGRKTSIMGCGLITLVGGVVI